MWRSGVDPQRIPPDPTAPRVEPWRIPRVGWIPARRRQRILRRRRCPAVDPDRAGSEPQAAGVGAADRAPGGDGGPKRHGIRAGGMDSGATGLQGGEAIVRITRVSDPRGGGGE